MWSIKRIERRCFILTLFVSIACMFYGMTQETPEKWISSSGLLLTAAGVFQIEASGFFHNLVKLYEGDEKGPPSYVTREIIDNPEKPIRTWFRNILHFEPRTGLWIIIVGTFVQIAANCL